MLRAAYYAQELLSTFSTTLGEVALVPATGGVFSVDIIQSPVASTPDANAEGPSDVKEGSLSPLTIQLWDRKTQAGFPGPRFQAGKDRTPDFLLDVKELKRLVRDIVEPTRSLGHVDRHGSSLKADTQTGPVVPDQFPNQQKRLPVQSPTTTSTTKSMAASTMSALPNRSKNHDSQKKQPTPEELVASQTAERMVADIMSDFQGRHKHDGTIDGSGGLRISRDNDGVKEVVAHVAGEEKNEEGGSHDARQGCEDCA
ncbi:MAG: hypothetical protein Q9213_005344 [Squamulea squamosa]